MGIRNERESKGINIPFDKDTKFASRFSDNFSSSNQNKRSLYIFLAKYFMEIHESEAQILVVTLNEGIIFSYDDMRQDESINCCTSEEADARLIRHAINQSKNSFRQIVIKIENSDVLMLATAS